MIRFIVNLLAGFQTVVCKQKPVLLTRPASAFRLSCSLEAACIVCPFPIADQSRQHSVV